MLRNCPETLLYKSYAAQGSKFPPYEHFYGIPAHSSSFKHIGQKLRFTSIIS